MATLEFSPGGSSILQLTSPIPGLSLVILREKIQDYNLIGCVKSAGKWASDLLKKHLQLGKCLTETLNLNRVLVNPKGTHVNHLGAVR